MTSMHTPRDLDATQLADRAAGSIGAVKHPPPDADALVPVSVGTSRAWPSAWRWIAASRRNALELFPDEVYESLRVDHRIFGRRLVVLSDPASIRMVCGTRAKRYSLANLHLRMLRPSLGDGLIVAQGNAWRRQRRHAHRLVAQPGPVGSAELVEKRVAELVAAWRTAGCAAIAPAAPATAAGRSETGTAGSGLLEVEPLPGLVRLALDLLAVLVFGHDQPIGTPSVVEMIDAHRRAIEDVDLGDVLGLPPLVRTRKMRRAERIVQDFDDMIEAVLLDKGVTGRNIDPMLGASRRDFVVSMLSGFESVATTSLWCLALLAHRPDIRRAIDAEPMPSAAARGHVAAATPPSLLEAVVRETLRIYPPLPLIYRYAVENDDLPAGPVRRGTLICISPWIVHHHRALWRQPDSFEPQRWYGAEARSAAYLPFGLGARHCVGQRLGFLLVQQIIKALVDQVPLADAQPPLPKPRAGVSLRPATALKLSLREPWVG